MEEKDKSKEKIK